MAGYLNRAEILGNVGADPDIRSLNNGSKVASFRVATSESWKDKNTGEKKERTEWHSVVIWNEGLVGIVEKYVKKGSKILVEGELQTRKWERAGIDRYSTEIVLTGFGGKLLLLGDGGGGGGRASDPNDNAGRSGNSAGAGVDDEIPF